MRIKNSHLNKAGDTRVYDITLGKDELRLLRDLASEARLRLPKLFELSSTKNRLFNIVRGIDAQLEKEKK